MSAPQRLARLTRPERLRLMRFVCAAVWSDLEVSPSERSFIMSLALRLELPEDEIRHVNEWLERPPAPEEVDPNTIPRAHRRLFLDAMEQAIRADRAVDPPEAESLRLLRELLG
ncbi:MAG TPA: TerB family tellurite resistance protein [Vicinamibacteria bacterium]|nr:TerB family tellurite resistance protein [Vicinamibacteria bacterium]